MQQGKEEEWINNSGFNLNQGYQMPYTLEEFEVQTQSKIFAKDLILAKCTQPNLHLEALKLCACKCTSAL